MDYMTPNYESHKTEVDVYAYPYPGTHGMHITCRTARGWRVLVNTYPELYGSESAFLPGVTVDMLRAVARSGDSPLNVRLY